MMAPNQSAVNRVYAVRLRRNPSRTWTVLAKDAEEAILVVLAGEPRLKFEDLTADEV